MKGEKLYIITTLFNPQRYSKRYQLHEQFERYVLAEPGVVLITVECALGGRPFVTRSKGRSHKVVHVRSESEIWVKENLTNIGLANLPAAAKYVAWIDADVMFSRPDWVAETIAKLQHYSIVQMWSHAIDLDAAQCPYQVHSSFAYDYLQNMTFTGNQGEYFDCKAPAGSRLSSKFHPGFAWAARREVLDTMGGLIDIGILGAGDQHMAQALVGRVSQSLPAGVSDIYKNGILLWQQSAGINIKGNFGYVEATVFHYFHGAKKNRRYWDRWKILTENHYNPEIDITRNRDGVLELTARSQRLRDAIRNYFKVRNEDCIHLEEGDKKPFA